MLDAFHILAESDDVVGKIIVGVIVFIIWGVGALVNMAKKTGKVSPQAQADMERAMRAQMEEARRRQAAMALEQMNPAPMPPPMVAPSREPRRGPAVPPMRNISQRQVPPRVPQPSRQTPILQNVPKQKKSKQRRQPVVTVPAPWASALPQDTPGVVQSAIGQGTAPASPARRQMAQAIANAPLIRITPASLRQQFILTEILQKPLALREDH